MGRAGSSKGAYHTRSCGLIEPFWAPCGILLRRAALIMSASNKSVTEQTTPFPFKKFLSPKYWPTWLALGLVRLITLLPLKILALLGHGLGMLAYYLGASRRRIALKNIQACFPEWSLAECERINKRHFSLVGQSVFTVPANMWVSKSRFEKRVTITERSHYDRALQEGQNIILLLPHFIGFDTAGFIVSMERDATSMYQYAKNALMDEVVKRGRMRYGGVLIERKAPLRSIIKAIRKGTPFVYLPDQDAGRKGLFVPFFHTPASTIPALGKFAKLGNAVVIPVMSKVKPYGGGYEVSFGEPMADFPSGDDVADTTAMNKAIEAMVRAAPEQYFWVHKRFKTRPPEETEKFY